MSRNSIMAALLLGFFTVACSSETKVDQTLTDATVSQTTIAEAPVPETAAPSLTDATVEPVPSTTT
ncbi:MAG: hypothetical protein WA208_04075, partial [Thermoanaerobaculia bacterium]